jgi:hypothetical protein
MYEKTAEQIMHKERHEIHVFRGELDLKRSPEDSHPFLHTAGVTCSIHVSPTISINNLATFGWLFCCLVSKGGLLVLPKA